MILFNMFVVIPVCIPNHQTHNTMKPAQTKIFPNCLILLFLIPFLSPGATLRAQCMIEGDAVVCRASLGIYENTASYPGGTVTYLWYANGGGVVTGAQDQADVQIFWSQPGSWVVYNQVYRDGALIDACTFNVQVDQLAATLEKETPGYPIEGGGELGKLIYCIGDQVGYTVTSAHGPIDYVWHLSGAEVSSLVTQDGIELSFTESGVVQICAIVTNTSGCQDILCEEIEVIDPSGLDFEPFPPHGSSDTLHICKGQEYHFENLSTPVLGFGYRWTVAYNDNTWTYYTYNKAPLTYLFGDAGVYEITLDRNFDAPACVYDPDTLIVVVGENRITPVLCPNPVCSGDEICYETPADCVQYTWTISEEGSITGHTNDAVVCVEWNNVSGRNLGAISLAVTDCTEDQCEDPTVVYVPIFPTEPEIEGGEMICGESYEFYSIPSLAGAADIHYAWSYQILSGSGDVTLGSPNSAISRLTFHDFAGTIRLSVIGTENMGTCAFEASKVITVYNTRIETESLACFGSDIPVELFPSTTEPVDWFVYDHFGYEVYQELMAGSTFSIPASAGLPPGEYTIAAMMPGGFPGACMVDTPFVIREPVPTPVITGVSLVCPGSSHTYSSNVTGTYEWIVTGGEITSPSSTGRVITVTWNNAVGPYLVRARRQQSGCYSEYAIKEIHVQQPGDQMIMGNPIPCPDNIEPERYSVSFDGASNINWRILPPHAHLGSLVAVDQPGAIGIYWHFAEESAILLEVTAQVCDTIVSDTFRVSLQPYTPAYAWPDTICQYAQAHFDVPEASGYAWYINGQLLEEDTMQSLDHVFTDYGLYHITAALTEPGGCAGTYRIRDSVFISPAPIPAIFLEQPLPCPEGTPFDSIYLETLEYPGFNDASYAWFYEGALIGTSPKVMISDTGLYTLVVSIGGCADSSSYQVTYDCDGECPCEPEVYVNIDSLFLRQELCGHFDIRGSIIPFLGGNVTGARYRFPLPVGNREITEEPQLSQSHIYHEPGVYHIKLQADWACDSVNVCTVTDVEALRVPVISDFVWDFACIGDGESYLVTARDASRAIDSLQANAWTGDISPQADRASIQFTAAAGSAVEVCLTQTTTQGYSCTRCQWIDVPGEPSAAFAVDAPGICLDTEVQMIPDLMPADQIAGVLWDFGDGSVSRIQSPYKKYSATGSYPVSLTVETIQGCSVSALDTLEVVYSTMDGEIEIMAERCSASVTLGFNLTSGGPVQGWAWSTGETDSTIVVASSDLYSLTVTDANGCTFEPESQAVQVIPPFPSGITGDLAHCTRMNLKVIAVGGYVYDWHVTGPAGYDSTSLASATFIVNNLNPGLYSVVVTASDTSGVCSDTTVEVMIYGNPPPPEVTIDIANCMPSQVVLSANHVVHWISTPSYLLSLIAQEIEVANLGGRVIAARYTDENNCSSSTSVQIPQAIDFAPIGSGCGEACPDSVRAGFVCLEGIPGIFDFWEWRLDGTPISGASGDSMVECLLLDTTHLNRYITLYVENDGCEEESPLFFIKKVECPRPCPDSLSMNWMSGLNGISCLHQALEGEKILYLDVYLFVPDGYVYCGGEPVFEDGYFEANNIAYDSSSHLLHVEGEYHITNISGFDEDYIIRGIVNLCPEGDTTQSCPAYFEISQSDCHQGCTADPCDQSTECAGSLALLEVYEGIGFYELCVTLPENPPLGDCTYEDYWIHVYQDGWVTSGQVDAEDIVADQYCFEFEYPMQLSDSCFYVIVENVCFDEEYCDGTFCPDIIQLQSDPPVLNRSTEAMPSKFEIIPNPASGEQVMLRCSDKKLGIVEIDIIDARGSRIDRQVLTWRNGEGSLRVNHLSAGYYFVRITTSGPGFDGEVLPMIILK